MPPAGPRWETINQLEAAVVIVVNTSKFDAIGFCGFQLKLVRRLTVVERSVLADWRVHCEAPTLIVERNVISGPDREFACRLSLNSYAEKIRKLSLLLTRPNVVFHDREAVLDALRLSLSHERTTDVGLNVHVRNDALRAGGTCWQRSRRTLVKLQALWGPLIGGIVPEDGVSVARGFLQMFNRVAHPIPQPHVHFVNVWLPAY